MLIGATCHRDEISTIVVSTREQPDRVLEYKNEGLHVEMRSSEKLQKDCYDVGTYKESVSGKKSESSFAHRTNQIAGV